MLGVTLVLKDTGVISVYMFISVCVSVYVCVCVLSGVFIVHALYARVCSIKVRHSAGGSSDAGRVCCRSVNM